MLTVTNNRHEQEYDEHELTMLIEQASTAAEALEPTTLIRGDALIGQDGTRGQHL